AAQILLLREFLIVFAGNEFSIGIILANWVILEACGSFLGRKAEKATRKSEAFAVLSTLFCLALFAALFAVRVLKRAMGLSVGESIGLLPMFVSSFLILSPVSVLHGALFPFSCEMDAMSSELKHGCSSAGMKQGSSNPEVSSAGRVYAYETVGTVLGGLVCTYLLIPHLDAFQAAAGLALLNAAVCLALLAPHRETGGYRKTTLALVGAFVLVSLLLISQAEELHWYSIQAQWENQHVVHYQNSRYGNLCVVENEGQYIFFQDGIPTVITPIPDLPFVEEFVHLPLLAHPGPKSLLVVSGGAGGVIHEALKHPSVATIEYVELDPLLIELFRKFPTALTESELNDARVTIRYMDGRLWLETTRATYDVILVGITEPSTLQTNRFFTQQFLSLAKERLNRGGILVLGLPGSLAYLNEELKDLNSCIFHTLKRVFSHIRVIPGDGTNLFLASDSAEVTVLDKDKILERLSQRHIIAQVVVPWYIEQKLHPGWQSWFLDFIAGSSQKINEDFNPIGVFYSVAHWNALFAPSAVRWLFRQLDRINLWGIVLLGAVLLLVCFFFRPRSATSFRAGIPLAIITTGFAGMIFDLMLTFAFQSIYGYVFWWIGLLVASFMAGAACGAMIMTRVVERTERPLDHFVRIELAIMGFCLACPAILFVAHAYLGGADPFFLFRLLFLAISFVSGFLVGAQFPLANKLYLGNSASVSKTAGLLYASDLLGGWLGGIVGAVVLLPVLGLVGTCLTVAMLKLVSFVAITMSSEKIERV
ncbi:MAG: fused MFS/spermidine synthase, partial [Chloroflexi bacterium]|nr:fused MFS/spermidine synthase [Chloroflexota bacterium]